MATMVPSVEPHLRKRPRYNSSWESSLVDKDDVNSKFGLVDLFGSCRPKNVSQGAKGLHHHAPSGRNQTGAKKDAFFTMRLEHREGGPMAQHFGEERILLFRSDQPGVIAKIIYSSSPPEEQKIASQSASTDGSVEAKVHVLSVKEGYRGFDFGGLLFSEAMYSLRHRYFKTGDGKNSGADCTCLSAPSVQCQLDAEEDVRRHNKLVGFYENLGCKIKPKAKISYINNNDGETYRKVPMVILLNQESACDRSSPYHQHGSLVNFLPIILLESPGKRVSLSNTSSVRVDWLVVETGEGVVQFRTTTGKTLVVVRDGVCKIAAETDLRGSCECSSNFQLIRVSDSKKTVLESDEDDGDEESVSIQAKQRELWMVKSCFGTFLALDPKSRNLVCSRNPAFWQADEGNFSLTSTSDTPARRQHYRIMWEKQTVEYVQKMRTRYLGFSLPRMGLKRALDLSKSLPAKPFFIGSGVESPSLRTLMYHTAELARTSGRPDWVQFLALVYGLAGVLNFIDAQTALETDKEFDWTLCSSSRVVGCRAPDSAIYNEFRALNPDEQDSRYNTPTGIYDVHCGLDKALLAWTGTEYMFHMLEHNHVEIPGEGLAALRYFNLREWHDKGEYSLLTNEEDEDVQLFVSDFDEMRRQAYKSLGDPPHMTDEQCDFLWKSHYSHVVKKFGADGLLEW